MARPNEKGRLRPGAVPVRPGEPWITGRVYQWNGVQWFMIPPPTETNRQNADLYLTATSDATEGAPEAIFSFAQIRSLVASSIFANLVGAKHIIVNTNGAIQSEDYLPGQRGFIIRANGTAEFNNATFRGHIEALSGMFQNVELQNVFIGNQAIFEGSIHSGPLFASNDPSTPSPSRSWPAGTSIATIRSNLGVDQNETRTIDVSGGSLGGTTGLIRLEFVATGYIRPPAMVPAWNRILRVVFANNTFTFTDTINQTLAIGGTTAGQTLRFFNLPSGGEGLPAGTVWRDSSGILRAV
ncbi:MAG: hypothetical protein FWB78_12660 [Treponema sp.]|nr:hypothetical protein [Treponema sp.]